MAKNAQKTDAFGMALTPDTFGVKEERTTVRHTPPKPGKSLTRNISITLQEEAIEKLNKLAEEQDISKSKVINRWLMSL
jgi:hypothetical protein